METSCNEGDGNFDLTACSQFRLTEEPCTAMFYRSDLFLEARMGIES